MQEFIELGDWVEITSKKSGGTIEFEIEGLGTFNLYEKTKAKYLGKNDLGQPRICYKNYLGTLKNGMLAKSDRPNPTRRKQKFEKLIAIQRELNYKPGTLYRVSFAPNFESLAFGLNGEIVLFVESYIKRDLLKCSFIWKETLCERAMCDHSNHPIFSLTEVVEEGENERNGRK
jgi:hypothetical protein